MRNMTPCEKCSGTGNVVVDETDDGVLVMETCDWCDGEGQTDDETCPYCQGSGGGRDEWACPYCHGTGIARKRRGNEEK